MKQPRRNALEKERFLEGNRQRWAAVFVVSGFLVMVSTSYGWIKDPAPFLQFFLSIGVTFILGASATAVMNSWKVSSQSQTQNLEEHRESKEEIKEEITYTEKQARPRDFDDIS